MFRSIGAPFVLALTCVCCGTHLPLTVGSPAAAQEKSTTPSDEDLVPGAIMRLSSECSTLAKFDAGPPPRFVVPAQCAEAAREANRNTEAEYIAKHDQLSQSVTIRNCLKAKGIASLDEAIKDQDQTDRVTSGLASVRRADGAAAVDAPPIEYITPVNALITGDKLYSACQSQNEEDRGVCFGYVMGVSDALSSPNGLFGLYACLGKGVKVGALRDIVVKFLAEHEVKRHLAAATLLTEALAERFPCPGHHFVAKRRSVSQEDQINQMLDSIDPHVSGWGPPKALDGTH